MSKHTPGPWEAELLEAYCVRAPHGGAVARMCYLKGKYGSQGRIDPDEAAANARLMAAAPKLLEALRKIESFRYCDDCYCEELHTIASAAIAAAEEE